MPLHRREDPGFAEEVGIVACGCHLHMVGKNLHLRIGAGNKQPAYFHWSQKQWCMEIAGYLHLVDFCRPRLPAGINAQIRSKDAGHRHLDLRSLFIYWKGARGGLFKKGVVVGIKDPESVRMIDLHIDLDGMDTRKNPDEEVEDDAEDGNSRENRQKPLYLVVHKKLHSKLCKKYLL